MYKKVLAFTPTESVRYGDGFLLRNAIMFTDIKDTIEIYCNERDDIEYILDAMIFINKIFQGEDIANLKQFAKHIANKNK